MHCTQAPILTSLIYFVFFQKRLSPAPINDCLTDVPPSRKVKKDLAPLIFEAVILLTTSITILIANTTTVKAWTFYLAIPHIAILSTLDSKFQPEYSLCTNTD